MATFLLLKHLGEFAVKKILLLILISFADLAVAADAAKADLPHGGMATAPGAGMPSGHPYSIPA
jgi:hypothetical protein